MEECDDFEVFWLGLWKLVVVEELYLVDENLRNDHGRIWGFHVFKETVHARLQCFGWISIRGGHAFRVGLNKFWLMQIPEIDSGRIGGFEISEETLQARIQCLRIFLIRGVHACSVEF